MQVRIPEVFSDSDSHQNIGILSEMPTSIMGITSALCATLIILRFQLVVQFSAICVLYLPKNDHKKLLLSIINSENFSSNSLRRHFTSTVHIKSQLWS